MTQDLHERRQQALNIVESAASTALDFFRNIDGLSIEQKGFQDLVSNADKGVETQIRDALAEAFPADGIIGEEHGRKTSASGYTWVIDPIDGTANFVRGTPGWCVVLACVKDDVTVLGIIRDAVADETFVAELGMGATLNGKRLTVSASKSLSDGSTAIGFSHRVPRQWTINALTEIINCGGVFYRNASGALGLAYVAAGRLVGYCEPHMNAWDCLAGMLLVTEAGGQVQPVAMQAMLDDGERVIAACPGVYQDLITIGDRAYQDVALS